MGDQTGFPYADVAVEDHRHSQDAQPQLSLLHAYGYNKTHTGQYYIFSTPDLYRYAVCTSAMLAVFTIFDFIVAHRTKARYYAIHVLANSVIVVVTAPSLFWLLTNPLGAFASDQFSHLAVGAHLAIHIYHVAAFNDLTWLDWLHHGVMVGLFSPGAMAIDRTMGPALDANAFFLCGLPGGLDYAMLFAVRHGWMHPLTEKKYNAMLNTWIRSPGSMTCCTWAWLIVFAKKPDANVLHPARLFDLCMIVMNVWNAQYFTSRVVANYHVRLYQEEEKKKRKTNGGQC